LNNLSDRIRLMRIAQGLSQTQLAEQIGITQAFMSELEKGKKTPSVDVLEKLCGALGCSADYLLGTPKGSKHSVMKEETLPIGLAPKSINPNVLQEVIDRNVTEDELKLALKFVKVMQADKNK